MIDLPEDLLQEVEELDEGESYSVLPLDDGCRLDVWISNHTDISRSQAAKMIEEGTILLDGQKAVKKQAVSAGQQVTVLHTEPQELDAIPENIPLDIVYEDLDIVVINKPKGMVVHPAPGHATGTLVNALLYHCGKDLSGIGGVFRPGIVHRIDMDTSGLLVVAKNDHAHLFLSEQLKTHTISRVYHAITIGHLKEQNGTVNEPIGRHPIDRKKMAVIHDPSYKSREAITHYEVLEPLEGHDHVICRLETGRTHQIRVHMAYLGHPLMGDELYGGAKDPFALLHKKLIAGQCLHANELQLIHPTTKQLMHFECPLPNDMCQLIELLKG